MYTQGVCSRNYQHTKENFILLESYHVHDLDKKIYLEYNVNVLLIRSQKNFCGFSTGLIFLTDFV